MHALSAAAHNKAELVADRLEGVLPRLYGQTAVDESLVRTVDLGPFKHKIDDGLELRKAAFEAMDVLLDTCRTRLAIDAFLQPLSAGLKVVLAPCLSGLPGHVLCTHLTCRATRALLGRMRFKGREKAGLVRGEALAGLPYGSNSVVASYTAMGSQQSVHNSVGCLQQLGHEPSETNVS